VKGSERNRPCHCGSTKKYKKCCLEGDRERERGERPALTIDGSNSPNVEEGHIVPRTYQRAWEIEGRRVAVHSIETEGCALKTTRRVATRGPFYRRWRPGGDQIDDVEKSLNYIETKATRPLRALIEGQPLDAERKGIVAQFFAAQIFRGPAFFRQREETLRPALEGLGPEQLQPRALAVAGGDVALVREQAIAAYLDPTQQFVTMLTYAVKVASVLGLMRWQLLRFEEPLLAYSDHPVVLWPLGVPESVPFEQQGLGALQTLEIRVPIAPDVAILMNWLDRSDQVDLQLPAPAAAELNAFTVGQADSEWMHMPGSEPPVAEGMLKPLSRLIDPGYGRETVIGSARHARARHFLEAARDRRFVNEVEVLLDLGAASSRAA
jgi:hypothetical protein